MFFAYALDIVDFVEETLSFRSVLDTTGNVKRRYQYEVDAT